MVHSGTRNFVSFFFGVKYFVPEESVCPGLGTCGPGRLQSVSGADCVWWGLEKRLIKGSERGSS